MFAFLHPPHHLFKKTKQKKSTFYICINMYQQHLRVHTYIYIKRWQRVLQEKRLLSNKARRRALLELRNALDLAGQVYTFGTGAYGQFGGEVSKDIGTKSTPFVGFEDIAKLWHGRVTPADSFLATIGADDPGAKKLADLKVKQN
jgi:hypothetical protein